MEVVKPSNAGRKRGAGPGSGTTTAVQQTYEPLKLERVLGGGSCSTGVVAVHHPVVPGVLAYTAGAVIVLYDSLRKQQTGFLSPKPKRAGRPYACIAFSRDGAYLAAGEHGGQSPEILVWDTSSGRCLQALRGHKHGVSSLSFSHDARLLVSTGESYDGQLCVWDWQAGVLLAKQHTQAEVSRACFVEEAGGPSGITIATVGKGGHCKVWTLSLPVGRGRDGYPFAVGQVALTPRPANLKEYRNSSIVAVSMAPAEIPQQPSQPQAPLYALTSAGVLLTLRPSTRMIDKSVNLQVTTAFALAVSPALVACACAAGVVRLFATRTLAFRGNLPRPAARGASGAQEAGAPAAGAVGTAPSGPSASQSAALFSDAVGCSFDSSGERLTVVYGDRSIVVWDVRNPGKVVRMRSVLSHSGIIWSAGLIPSWQTVLLGPPQAHAALTPCGDQGPAAPSSVLCTCGADGTVRLWNVCLDTSASTAGPTGLPSDVAAAARVTRTLRAIIYVNPPAAACEPAAGPSRRCAPDAPLPVAGMGPQPIPSSASSVVVRCLRISPCGRHLATGDNRGNVRIYSLATLTLLHTKEAHDAEVLTLDYSSPSLDGSCYLTSGSRDTLVHVYDMTRGYELAGTCDAHSAAVTAARFSASSGRLALLSCSADKSVVFRHVQLGASGLSFRVYQTERLARGVLYDMAVDPTGGRAVAVGADGQLRVFDVATGRAMRNFCADPSCGEVVGVVLDPTGHLAVCSCSDGSVAVYDVDAGVLVARGSGHGEVCTGAVLLEDHRGLVSIGGDGTALLWRLTPRLARRMQEAAAECRRQMETQAAQQAALVAATPAVAKRRAWNVGPVAEGAPLEEPQQVHVDVSATMLRVRQGMPLLSVDRLPRWAQRVHGEAGDGLEAADVLQEKDMAAGVQPAAAPQLPAGKWAQRVVAPVADVVPVVAQQVPFVVVAPAAAAATAGALAPHPAAESAVAIGAQPLGRGWSADEDDEIVLYDPQEEGEPAQPEKAFVVSQDAGAEPTAPCAGSEDDAGTQLCAAGTAGSGAARDEGSDPSVHAVSGAAALTAPQASEEVPESVCASNRPNGPPGAELGAVAGDGVKRDLFREYFDTLGIDQASATKPAQDPRRQSLSLLFRQARGAAAAPGTPAAPSLLDAAPVGQAPKGPSEQQPVPRGTEAAPRAVLGEEDGSTPYLAKLPLPAGITATRGTTAGGMAAPGATAPALHVDGAVNSAAWTPERAMLPLTSPVLANTDKQLQELQRMRERIVNSLHKKPQNPAAAVRAAPAAAPTATAPAVQPTAAAGATQPQQLQQQPARCPAQPAVRAPVEGAAKSIPVAAPSNAQQPVASAVTFALAGTDAYDGRSRDVQAHLPLATTVEVGPLPSPGFSSLSVGTPMLGQGEPGAAYPALGVPGAAGSAAGASDGADASGGAPWEAQMHYNPMYGATPGTPAPGRTDAAPWNQEQAPQGAAVSAPVVAPQPVSSALAPPVAPVAPAVPGPVHAPAAGHPCQGPNAVPAPAPSVGDSMPPSSSGAAAPVGASTQQPQDAGGAPPHGVGAARTDDVITRVLQTGGPAGDGGGVCVVKQDGKAQAAGAAGAAASPQQRRPKVALPTIKAKPGGTPVSTHASLAADGLPDGPSEHAAEAPLQAPAEAVVAPQQEPVGTDMSSQAYAGALAQMQRGLRDFCAAYRALHPTAGGSGGPPPARALGAQEAAAMQQQYRECAQDALAELGALLDPRRASAGPIARSSGGGAAETAGHTARTSGGGAAAVGACDSPTQRAGGQARRLDPQPASRCSAGGVGSSQVVLEVGLMESIVEEKVHEKVAAQLKVVEEMVMQRIMQQMQQQRQ